MFVAAFGEFACGSDTVARLEAVQPAVHGIVEEVDDGLAVVGHLADDFGEGRWLIFGFGLGFCCEHVFYCNAGRRMGSTGGWRGRGNGVKCGRGARCGVSFCAGRQVTPVIVTLGFARPRSPGFRIRSGMTKGGAGRLTGVFTGETSATVAVAREQDRFRTVRNRDWLICAFSGSIRR